MLRMMGFLAALMSATAVMAQSPAPSAVTAPAADPANIVNLDLSTGGRVRILLRPDMAPNHVERFKTLVRRGFYDGLAFHRVIDGFMAQGGDPKGDGTGGSELPDLQAEFNALPHVRGAVSMAHAADPNSGNSQFFIVFSPVLRLDREYTVFGRVIEGMAYVDAIERGEPPTNPSRVVKASMADQNIPPPAPSVAGAPAAASAAAGVASAGAADASLAADEASRAASRGDGEAAEGAVRAAKAAAEAAVGAANDAAAAASDAVRAASEAESATGSRSAN